MSGSVPTVQTGRLAQVKDSARRFAHGAIAPLVGLCARAGIGPDLVTVVGTLISVGAALAFFEGAFRLGSGLLLLGGLCDMLDGELARHQGRVSRFGAFLDSTLDRVSESLVLVGIVGFYVVGLLERVYDPGLVPEEIARGLEPRTWAVLAITGMLALVGSFMVSYTRARAEGLGLECRVGWFERPERLLLILIAGGFGVGPAMPAALLILTVLSFATAAQRVAHVWKHTRAD
jgi:CDP-diacylglycerol--glycerol-3-phosphate 3-phosphatidyltransferase